MSYMISKIVILENSTFLLIMHHVWDMSLLSRITRLLGWPNILSKLQVIIPSF